LSSILNSGPVVWVVVGLIVLLLMRSNKDVGISNLLVQLLQQLLNTVPDNEMERSEQRAAALLKMSDHLREQEDEEKADGLLGFLPALIRKGRKE